MYFTNSAEIPTNTLFDTYYNAAEVRKALSVAAGNGFEMSVATAAAARSYLYAAVLMKDTSGTSYQALVIPNLASDGFTVEPSVSTSGTYEYLSYTPALTGTVYYYYTNETSAPSASSFASSYNSSTVTYKGTLNATKGKAASQPTQIVTSIASYKSVVVMFTDSESGLQYTPTIVNRSATMGTGFNAEPFCSASAAGFTLMYTSAVTGTMEYYFSASDAKVSAQDFSTYKDLVGPNLSGAVSVTPGQGQQVISAVAATTYPYLVVRLSSSNGTIYQPVVITITGSTSGGAATSSLENTGFTAAPKLGAQNGKYTLTCSTVTGGVIYYYLTSNDSVPTINEFSANYKSSTSTNLSQKNGGSYNALGAYAQAFDTGLPTNVYGTFKYLAVLFDPTGTALMGSTSTAAQSQYGYYNPFGQQQTAYSQYRPLLITLTEQASTGDSGFLFLPQIDYDYTGLNVRVTPAYTGELYYYFTNDPTVPDADQVIGQFLFGLGSSFEYDYGTTYVSAGNENRLTFNVDAKLSDYIVMILRDQNGQNYSPVVAAMNGSNVSGTPVSGFAAKPTVTSPNDILTLNYSVSEPGTLYYFFTNYGSTAYFNTYTQFMSQYNSMNSSYSGTVPVANMGSGSLSLAGKSTYPYMALLFVGAARQQQNVPIVISTMVQTTSAASNETSASTGFSVTPTLQNGILTYTPSVQGTLFYAFSDTDSYAELMKPVQVYILIMMRANQQSSQATSGMSNWNSISSMIAQSGGGSGMSVYNVYQQQTLNLQGRNTSNKRYLAVWMVASGSSSMLSPVFLNASSIGNYGGTTGGTSGYTYNPFETTQGMATTGFSGVPTWQSYGQSYSPTSVSGMNGVITYTPSLSGQLFVLYTNTLINTAQEFQNYYLQAANSAMYNPGMATTTAAVEQPVQVTAGQTGTVMVYDKMYSYAYLYIFTGSTSQPTIPVSVYLYNSQNPYGY